MLDPSIFNSLVEDVERCKEIEYWGVRVSRGHLLLHKKGGIYKFKKFVTSTVDGSIMVLYDHLWPHEMGTWVRPYEEFIDGRFVEVSPFETEKWRPLGPNYFNLLKGFLCTSVQRPITTIADCHVYSGNGAQTPTATNGMDMP